MRPSCGWRFSAMSRRAMILMRDTITPCTTCGGSSTSRSMPSLRKRRLEGVARKLSQSERPAERALYFGEDACAHPGPDPELEACLELPGADHAVPLGKSVRQPLDRARVGREGVRGHIHALRASP